MRSVAMIADYTGGYFVLSQGVEDSGSWLRQNCPCDVVSRSASAHRGMRPCGNRTCDATGGVCRPWWLHLVVRPARLRHEFARFLLFLFLFWILLDARINFRHRAVIADLVRALPAERHIAVAIDRWWGGQMHSSEWCEVSFVDTRAMDIVFVQLHVAARPCFVFFAFPMHSSEWCEVSFVDTRAMNIVFVQLQHDRVLSVFAFPYLTSVACVS